MKQQYEMEPCWILWYTWKMSYLKRTYSSLVSDTKILLMWTTGELT